MEISLLDLPPGDRYKILASLVTPRPIAWVTTLNETGTVNAAPFSFFNVFGSKPPLVAFAPGDREHGIPKDTAANIRRTGEFVIHLVSEDLAPQMVQTAAELPAGVSELTDVALKTSPSKKIQTPRIAEAPVALECREHQTIEIGANRLVLGLIEHVYVREGLFDPETYRLYQQKWTPVGRMASPDWYCRTDNLFEIKRPD